MSIFREAFSDDDGHLSSLRIMVCLIILTILGNWTYINVVKSEFTPFNLGDMGIIVGSLIAKAYQKANESREQ